MASEVQEFLTVKEVASILKIGRNQAYALCQMADFPSIKIGVQYRIPAKDFNEWCEQQKKG